MEGYVAFFLALCLLIPLVYIYLTWRFNELKEQGVDGPKPWPFIGNLNIMFKEGFFNLDKVLSAKYGKMYSFFEGRTPTLVVADPELAKQVMVKDHSNFVNRRKVYMRGELLGSVLDARDEHWKLIRSHITPAFSSGKLRQMNSLIVHASDNLVEKLKEHALNKTDFDAKKLAGNFTMEVIASTGFGLQLDTQNDENNAFVKYANAFFEVSLLNIKILVSIFLTFLVPLFEFFGASTVPTESVKFFKKEVFEALEQRRNNTVSRPDFLNLMVEAERENQKQPAKKKKVPTATLR